jgi:hypothetical protein
VYLTLQPELRLSSSCLLTSRNKTNKPEDRFAGLMAAHQVALIQTEVRTTSTNIRTDKQNSTFYNFEAFVLWTFFWAWRPKSECWSMCVKYFESRVTINYMWKKCCNFVTSMIAIIVTCSLWLGASVKWLLQHQQCNFFLGILTGDPVVKVQGSGRVMPGIREAFLGKDLTCISQASSACHLSEINELNA